jgi:hypothetical protein
MVMANQSGLATKPLVVAELGPGDSLGIGLMALLLGSEKYYAFDVVKFASAPKNLDMLNELISLLSKKEDIPDDGEFPRICPKLDDYNFPRDIYSEEYLESCLSHVRVSEIKKAISQSSGMIEYQAPWFDDCNIVAESVDMIISQAVLEHIDDLHSSYEAMYKWLKRAGFMTHCIDFKSHGKSDTWDGHWKMPNWYWFLLRGARPYLINREPFCAHKNIMKENKFNIISAKRIISKPSFSNSKLNTKFKNMPEKDRETSSVFIQVVK